MRSQKSPKIPLSCEFHVDDQLFKGPVVELHPDGFFVETDAPVERSRVLEILLENSESGQQVVTEAVVERRSLPTLLAPQQPRGLRLRLFHFSAEYGVLIGAMAPSESGGGAKPSERVERRTAERDWLSELGSDEAATPARVQALAPDGAEAVDQTPLLERAGEPVFEEESPAPKAVVIDDGELADVDAMLRSLGVGAHHATPDVDGTLRNWIAPSHLLIVTAKRALSLGHSLGLEHAAFAAFVVTDSDARTLHPIVQRLGYRFVVRRPVHPEALRTLIRQTLHRDSGRRSTPRVAIGCGARWKLAGSLRRHEGTLVDLSPDSCQLLVSDKVPLGSRVQIRIPATVTGQRRIDLVGRVVRRGVGSREQRALGVVFEDPPKRIQDRLVRLVQDVASGPARFDGCIEIAPPIAAPEAPEAVPAETPDDEKQPERRRAKRAVFERELVALDAGSEEVRLSLIGRDLSIDGMRVEPNPELEIDDHLRLAFYDCEDGDPLLLHAVVTRSDGRLGTCLRFIGLDSEARVRLERAIEELPSIESVEASGPEAAWAAIGQVELVPQPLD